MINKIIRTESEQKEANKMFNSFRDELLKRDLSNTENYDKTILTLSTAVLGFSLTVIKFLIPLELAEYTWLVPLGWLLLLISLVMSIIAFLLSNIAIKIQLKNAENYYINCQSDAFNRTNPYTIINNYFNLATGLIFTIGLVSIVTFMTINIKYGDTNMSKDKHSTIKNVNESANIPTMQKTQGDLRVANNSANIPTMQKAPETETTSQNDNKEPEKSE